MNNCFFHHAVTKPAGTNAILGIFLIDKMKIIEDWL